MTFRPASKENTMRHIAITRDKDYCLTTADLMVTDRDGNPRSWGKCSLGIIPEGREGRQVFQGPLVPGPWAFVTTHAAVIDNSGHSHAEYMAAERIALGEPFTVEALPGVWCFRPNNLRRLEGDGHSLTPFVGPLPEGA